MPMNACYLDKTTTDTMAGSSSYIDEAMEAQYPEINPGIKTNLHGKKNCKTSSPARYSCQQWSLVSKF